MGEGCTGFGVVGAVAERDFNFREIVAEPLDDASSDCGAYKFLGEVDVGVLVSELPSPADRSDLDDEPLFADDVDGASTRILGPYVQRLNRRAGDCVAPNDGGVADQCS